MDKEFRIEDPQFTIKTWNSQNFHVSHPHFHFLNLNLTWDRTLDKHVHNLSFIWWRRGRCLLQEDRICFLFLFTYLFIIGHLPFTFWCFWFGCLCLILKETSFGGSGIWLLRLYRDLCPFIFYLYRTWQQNHDTLTSIMHVYTYVFTF